MFKPTCLSVNILTSLQGTQLMLQSIVGDSILVYRIYIVYRRSILVTLLPLVLWLADIGVSIRGLQQQYENADGVYNPWYIAFWSLTVASNVITTSM